MHSKFLKFIFTFILSFTLCITSLFAKPPETSGDGIILINPQTNTILYEKNAHKRLYPASITKILTALIIAEEMPSDTLITRTSSCFANVPSDSSSIGLQLNDRYNMINALHGLLLGSDNYIAYDLAQTHSSNIATFANEMNERARQCGALNTHFTNPHGYHDPNHYTTAYDMAQIAKAAFSNPTVEKIAGKATSTFFLQNRGQALPITNTSRLLKSQTPYYNSNVVACKTGFHDDARQTLVAKAVYDDMELIAVSMKTSTPNQYLDVNRLFEYGHQNFSVQKTAKGYTLVNQTMSNWAKSTIDHALKLGWIVTDGTDYQGTITGEELIGILKNIKPLQNNLRANEITTIAHIDLNDMITRKNMAQIITYLNQKLIPSSETYIPTSAYSITDIQNLSSSDQNAIDYVTSNKLINLKDNNCFKPDANLTYEEALCVLYKYFI
ncbi:MAG: S-layer homology domain-containing protein [Cellulosilyticum sp.]|nr:S-layer homology domain-containing protein [Cellulosilyticum sp.]